MQHGDEVYKTGLNGKSPPNEGIKIHTSMRLFFVANEIIFVSLNPIIKKKGFNPANLITK
jgi:hypothetical protein